MVKTPFCLYEDAESYITSTINVWRTTFKVFRKAQARVYSLPASYFQYLCKINSQTRKVAPLRGATLRVWMCN